MTTHPAIEAIGYAQDSATRLEGLLIAMRLVWDSLDASDEAGALRALIDCARSELQDIDDYTANARTAIKGADPAG